MPPRKRSQESKDWLFPKTALHNGSEDQSSLLDVVDSILNKGAVVNGDLILGVANVDLVYAKVSVLLAALDRIMAPGSRAGKKREPSPGKQARRRRR